MNAGPGAERAGGRRADPGDERPRSRTDPESSDGRGTDDARWPPPGRSEGPPAGSEPPLRIAFFTDSFAPTNDGVARVTATLAASLLARGHRVTVFTVRSPGTARWEVRGDGLRVRRSAAVAAPGYPQYRIALFPWWARAPGGAGFDVVHLHTPGFVGLAGAWFARRHGIPTVGTYHTNLSEMLRDSGRNRFSRAFFRSWGRFSVDLCRACDRATAPTESSRVALLGRGRVPLAREPWVVANGVDTTRFRPEIATPDWRVRWNVAAGVPLVTFLGRLTRDKGVHRFLDAIERLDPSLDWTAVVGGEGPQRRSVELRLGPGNSAIPRARYLGPVSEAEKPALLSQSQVFVLPSLSDTSSVALLEAMASGVPCVVTERGGPAEIARASGVGVVVDPADPARIAEAIGRLLRDAGLRRELSARGRTWVKAHASEEIMATDFLRCYRSVLRGPAKRRRGPAVRSSPGGPSRR